jgi:hypothetical protein
LSKEKVSAFHMNIFAKAAESIKQEKDVLLRPTKKIKVKAFKL